MILDTCALLFLANCDRCPSRYGLTEFPLDSAVCTAAAELPHHPRDPFDRFIIAAALRLRVPVVTIDPKFSPYGVEVVG